MFSELNLEMENAHQGILSLKKIDSKLTELLRMKSSLEDKLRELVPILQKEDIDVEKLEGKSLASIFYSILGNLQTKIDKERTEALNARLKVEQSTHELEMIKYEIQTLRKNRVKFIDCEKNYNLLYAKKKALLMESKSEIADKLMHYSELINISKSTNKEINEAISAGNQALDSLLRTLDSLNSAESWGTWDMFGGGLIADLNKHSKLDDAKSEVEIVQTKLRKFKCELIDIKIEEDINIEVGGFAKFADFFFDGLFADWHMQSKILNSQEHVSNVKDKVQSIIYKLSEMEINETTTIKLLEVDIDELIKSAV